MVQETRNFALIGAAGYVAPKHMRAIKETGHCLVAALDPSDSVGIIDSYFPKAKFFTEFERFDRHVYKQSRKGDGHRINYVSICSPNYLHDAHVRFALRNNAHAICEKPLVLNPWNIDPLAEMERDANRRVYAILQLRLHPTIMALRQRYTEDPPKEKVDVDLTYITSRGAWYLMSWKGGLSKSGGIPTNIGIHFYDMLIWLFGGVERSIVHLSHSTRAAGLLELKHARVRWFLSVNSEDLPTAARDQGLRTYRTIEVDGEAIEFSGGFDQLHTKAYEKILAGNGPGLDDARPSIELVHQIRHAEPIGLLGDYHPHLKNIVTSK